MHVFANPVTFMDIAHHLCLLIILANCALMVVAWHIESSVVQLWGNKQKFCNSGKHLQTLYSGEYQCTLCYILGGI